MSKLKDIVFYVLNDYKEKEINDSFIFEVKDKIIERWHNFTNEANKKVKTNKIISSFESRLGLKLEAKKDGSKDLNDIFNKVIFNNLNKQFGKLLNDELKIDIANDIEKEWIKIVKEIALKTLTTKSIEEAKRKNLII